MKRAVACVMFLMLAGQAEAAVVSRNFVLTASNFTNSLGDPSSIKALKINFGVTYDDQGSGFLGAPDSFVAVTDGAINAGPFSATPRFGFFQPFMGTFPRIVLGGELNGTNVMLNGTNDFTFSFDASATGPTPALLSFTSAGVPLPFIATDASVSPFAAAVPEAGTWAMMLAGFGGTGAVLRRRRMRGAARAVA